MKREIITTKDGSTSLYIPQWDETYHSKNGAIQETYHVFIKNGLSLFNDEQIKVLEIGLGIGLNAFVTFLEATKNSQVIEYTGVEAFPITFEEASKMNYPTQLNALEHTSIFEQLHYVSWNEKHSISKFFLFKKQNIYFEEIIAINEFDLIYFDAFGYDVQPQLWSEEIFKKMYDALKTKGVLVTYACRTSIKKAMQSAGFTIEKLPGALGKREMLRATKNELTNS